MSGLFDFSNPLSPYSPLGGYGLGTRMLHGLDRPAIKRKVYFSFHYEDIFRVNNVRNAWKIDHPDNALMRSFYDSSLWESKKLESEESIKKLIREGVAYTSAVCVLIGVETWSRRWVRYEVARAVIDGRGLLGVRINLLTHHKWCVPDPAGQNPLDFLGIYNSRSGQYYLFEKRQVCTNYLANIWEWQWLRYADYTLAVSLPRYLPSPDVGYVMPLSAGTSLYDHVTHEGHKNIGNWIDLAATTVGR